MQYFQNFEQQFMSEEKRNLKKISEKCYVISLGPDFLNSFNWTQALMEEDQL